MKWIFRVLATGPWTGGTVRNLDVAADSAAEAEQIVKSSLGAWTAKSFGHSGPFVDPRDLNSCGRSGRVDPSSFGRRPSGFGDSSHGAFGNGSGGFDWS